ncbi:presenilin family intramembrane aspartyl protease PSH [Methanogenium organophilum]|uniref:Presenilin family intramembrane aspartyl protease n=1 Tax=Methanogenium organophilum TaxID=2199 RepID=A0A9X9T7P6_METOG|nr:presenilin family intramembrane aspartyl protease PSH [Methanogenium organophilum]WAI01314.1 presenilin family intramembrane aspartyl protease [Methanogenium organophilum]
MNMRQIAPFIGMGVLMIAVQMISIFLTPLMLGAGYEAFEDPESAANPLYFIIILLIFTGVLLWLIRRGKEFVIKAIIAFSILFIFGYIYSALFLFALGGTVIAWTLTIVATVVSGVLLYAYPEWYIIDILGVLICGGAAAIFGISLTIMPVLILLVILAVYDAISVYRTKHMVDLAESVINMKTPILVVVPKSRNYSYIKEGVGIKKNKEDRGAYIMGMGDLIMPNILVVSSLAFLTDTPAIFGITLPTIGAMAGTICGLAALLWFVSGGKPQAGLPLLNGGAIAGFLILCTLTGSWAWIPGM